MLDNFTTENNANHFIGRTVIYEEKLTDIKNVPNVIQFKKIKRKLRKMWVKASTNSPKN